MRRFRLASILTLVIVALGLTSTIALAQGPPAFGALYYDREVVRTVVPPATMSKAGTDPLYVIAGGTVDQLPIAGVGPGDRAYRGGKWAVHVVTWNVDAYLLTSGENVVTAASHGHVTIVRDENADFKCPIQP